MYNLVDYISFVTRICDGGCSAAERDLIERYLEGLRTRGVPDVPAFETAFDRYRLFAAEAWDATAMTINRPGLQAQDNSDAAFRRTCAAVEDLNTAALMNRHYRQPHGR